MNRLTETKLLIERVEEMPELWNIISGQTNRYRVKKTAAIESLAEQFHIDSAEINRKLHNLRTQLNNELRKMRQPNRVAAGVYTGVIDRSVNSSDTNFRHRVSASTLDIIHSL